MADPGVYVWLVYCLNFISRIAARALARSRNAAARTLHTLPYLDARAPSNTCIRQQHEEDDRAGRRVVDYGDVGGKTPSGKPGGNTGSPAQAVPSALVIFPFYAFHSFVSLRMLAPGGFVCVRARQYYVVKKEGNGRLGGGGRWMSRYVGRYERGPTLRREREAGRYLLNI